MTRLVGASPATGARAYLRQFAPLAGRAGWGLLDQAFSSLTNFALGILVARTVPLQEFGAFTLAFAAYLVAVNASRAFPMLPLAIRYSAGSPEEWRRGSSAALGTVLLAGGVAGVAFVILGFALGGTIGPAFIALGLTLPGLLLQDGWRSAFFAGRRGSLAFVNDLVWAIALFPMLAAVMIVGQATVFWLTLTWGATASLAAIVGILEAGFRPRLGRAPSWWRENRDLGGRYLAEAAVGTGAGQATLFGVGAVAGLSVVGALRASQLLFGPLQIIQSGIGLVVVPEAVRALRQSVSRLERAALAMSAGLALGAIVWGILLIAIPDELGSRLLAGAWNAAAPLFGPFAVAYAGVAASIGPLMTLRALANARRSLRANVFGSTVTLILMITGAALSGSVGAAWGSAVGSWLAVAVWWLEAVKGVREYEPF